MEPTHVLTKEQSSRPWSHSKWWRIPATGIGFGLFGVGGVLGALSVFPLIYLLPIGQRRKEKITRLFVSSVFYAYIKILRGLKLLTYELHGVEQLREPNQLILANHPSLLDVVFIIALTGDTSCIVKAALWRNPFTGMAVRSANYVSNTDRHIMERCITLLKSGQSLIVFPEGTRSKPNEPLKFHRGPSNMALCSGVDITPVVIRCEPATLLKNQRWYEISDAPPHFSIRVLPRITLAQYQEQEFQSVSARQLTKDLIEFFERHR